MFGGKLTTHRRLSRRSGGAHREGARRSAASRGPRAPSCPAAISRPPISPAKCRAPPARYPGLPQAAAAGWSRLYGTKTAVLLGNAQAPADLGRAFRRRPYGARGRLSDRARMGAHGRGRAVAPHQAGPAASARRQGARWTTTCAAAALEQEEATMTGYVLAIDQGTTSSRAIVFDGKQQIAGIGQDGVHPAFPGLGLGRARARRDLGHLPVGVQDGAAQGRHRRPPTSPRSASPTSARPPSSGTARPASRSTTPSSGRTGAPPTLREAAKAPATKGWSPARPGCCSTPISPAPRSPGSSTT